MHQLETLGMPSIYSLSDHETFQNSMLSNFIIIVGYGGGGGFPGQGNFFFGWKKLLLDRECSRVPPHLQPPLYESLIRLSTSIHPFSL